jgi:hypothetical protein
MQTLLLVGICSIGNVVYCLQENAVGDCYGMYKKRQLFQAKKNHGKFIPLMSLVKEEDFLGSSSAGTVLFSKYLNRNSMQY